MKVNLGRAQVRASGRVRSNYSEKPMRTDELSVTDDGHANTLCPHCGGTDYEDNRIDDALYREAAKEAPRLRHEGLIGDAIEVLTALYAIRIANFLRPRWRCACGVSFDG